MQWEEYYDKLSDWAAATAVSKMSRLESFGPPDEIIDAINTIAFDDEQGATRLLKKATAAGVKFTGDQLSELFLICDETALHNAIRFSSDRFGTEDLAALYGFCDEEELIRIAEKQNIPLPEELAEYAQATAFAPEEEEETASPPHSPGELAAEYDYILDRLYHAHQHLVQACKLSFIDTAGKRRAATVLKYACIIEAEPYIQDAIAAWERLDIPGKDKNLLWNTWHNISSSTMWQNYLFEGFFTNMMVKSRIRKVIRNIEYAHKTLRRLRDSL